MGLGSDVRDLSTDRENVAENMQGKNQFARFRIFQNRVGDHFYDIYSLVMLTFRNEVISRYSDYLITFTSIFTTQYCMIRKFHSTLLPRRFNSVLMLRDAGRVERLLGELA